MSLISWFKGTAVNQVYTVSDITDTSKHTGPLPVALTGGGVAATDYGKAEDAAHTSGDVGVMALAVRNANRAVLAGTDLDYIPIGTNTQGNVFVSGTTGGIDALDAVSSVTTIDDQTGNGRPLITVGMLWNGSTANIARNNLDGTALASAARTAAVQSADIVNYNGRGIIVFLNVTVASGTGGLQVLIEGKDPVSGLYTQMHLNTSLVTAVATRNIAFYPGATASAGGGMIGAAASVNALPLPRTFRITIQVGDGSSYTYSVGYSIIL